MLIILGLLLLTIGALYGLERRRSAGLSAEVERHKGNYIFAKVQYGYAVVALEQNSKRLRQEMAESRRLRGERAAAEFAAELLRDSLRLVAYIEQTDSTLKRCEALDNSCEAVRARGDSALARADSTIDTQARQIVSERRKGWLTTAGAFVLGLLIGR